jgi:signal transduction histidine kinase
LEDFEYECKIETDSLSAVEFVKSNDPTIALVDLRLPDKNGIEVIKELKTLKKELPTIIISGTVDVNEAVNCLREGADDYILKPILNASELEIRIKQVLEKYALKKEIMKYQKSLENLIAERTKQLIERTDELVKSNVLLEEEIERRIEAENLVKRGALNIMMALEKERQRLAQELHDSIGQRLMFAKINLEIALKKHKLEDENLAATNENLTQISGELGSVIKSLFPVSIEKYSLSQNLSTLISDFEKTSQINVATEILGTEPALDKVTKLNLFRIFQELLNNIAKHSRADKIEIRISFSQEKIYILVCDNGVGLPPDIYAEQTKGTGLFSIKERIAQVGGKVDFRSGTEQGLTVEIEVPL